MPSGLLHDENVIFYHPLDDLTEYTKGLVWSSLDDNSSFVPGLLVSGIQLDPGNTFERIVYPASTYNSVENASGITSSMWVSGFLTADTVQRLVNIGIADDTIPAERNDAILYKVGSTTGFNTAGRFDGTFGSKVWTPPPSNDTDWHFFVIDLRYEGSGWRHRVSLDGVDWLDLGVVVHGGDVSTADSRPIIRIDDSTTATIVVDEVVFWGGNDLFTAQELSNLYELYNTHNTTMNQYSSTFGTLVSGSVDLFIEGNVEISGNISLYIPGQVETGRIDLFLSVISSSSGNIDNFILGHKVVSEDIDTYIKGIDTSSGNTNLYISGVPAISSSIDLYITGPIISSGDMDQFIEGHVTVSGDFSLFIDGSQKFDAFVRVVSNDPSNSYDLFMHGVPSGSSGISYTNSNISLFINDDGDNDPLVTDWNSFIRVADPLTIPHSGNWSSFARVGNTSNNNIDLYINAHASGESPRGITVTDSYTMFIEGLASQSGDEGLLSDGFIFIKNSISGFSRVHFGHNNSLDLYVSGEAPIIPPSATLDMFIFGITDIESGSFPSYIYGHEQFNDSNDLFVFGILGIESGNIPLYIEVTDTGVLNQQVSFYSHGF